MPACLRTNHRPEVLTPMQLNLVWRLVPQFEWGVKTMNKAENDSNCSKGIELRFSFDWLSFLPNVSFLLGFKWPKSSWWEGGWWWSRPCFGFSQAEQKCHSFWKIQMLDVRVTLRSQRQLMIYLILKRGNVGVSVCHKKFMLASNRLTPWFLVVVLTYPLFRILNPAIQELGWAMPHSDFLAWLSSATLKNFISGVSSRILMP